ncbi:hypothetical protein QUF70_05890 [Desulfobacterales bacterium HSG17]|nr:hypothetical protein [Desulfobacterales bacterium HSG17]
MLKPDGIDYHMNNPKKQDVRGVKALEINNLQEFRWFSKILVF